MLRFKKRFFCGSWEKPSVADQHYLPSSNPRLAAPRPVRSDWLSLWLGGESLDTTTLESAGFQADLYYAVVLYRPERKVAVNPTQFVTTLQTEAVRRNICGPVALYGQGTAVLFHPVEDPQQSARLKLKTEVIRKQLSIRFGDVDIHCGVGRPAQGMDGLRHSFHEAEDALQLSGELNSESRTTFFGNSSLFNLLRSTHNPLSLQRFCDNWLAELITYDSRQHSDLLATLRAYFANNGNTALTANVLGIHRNTLAYRLNRIAEITCLDLEDADVRLNLHLALKAQEILCAGVAS